MRTDLSRHNNWVVNGGLLTLFIMLCSCASSPNSSEDQYGSHDQQAGHSNPSAQQSLPRYQTRREEYSQRRRSRYPSVPTLPNQQQALAPQAVSQTPREQLKLGERYAYGRGVRRNDEEAIKWFRLAAEQGNAEAQYKLAIMLDKGFGTSTNHTEALVWYKRAADQGHASAENNIGNLYSEGRGVPVDKDEAERWYRRSAEHGENIGKQNLALLIKEKQIVPNGRIDGAESAKHTSGSDIAGPFVGEAAATAYLNALYRHDFSAVEAMDKQFARPYHLAMDEMGNSGIYKFYDLLTGGRVKGENIKKAMSEATENMSMVGPLTVTYVVNYEHIYPECMDASPLTYKQTVISQTVTKNMLGTELYRSPAIESSQYFRVNRRFKHVFDNLESADSSGAELIDKLIGDPKAVKLLDLMANMRQAMRDNKCNSKIMRQFEANLLAKYNDSREKINEAKRHVFK